MQPEGIPSEQMTLAAQHYIRERNQPNSTPATSAASACRTGEPCRARGCQTASYCSRRRRPIPVQCSLGACWPWRPLRAPPPAKAMGPRSLLPNRCRSLGVRSGRLPTRTVLPLRRAESQSHCRTPTPGQRSLTLRARPDPASALSHCVRHRARRLRARDVGCDGVGAHAGSAERDSTLGMYAGTTAHLGGYRQQWGTAGSSQACQSASALGLWEGCLRGARRS